MRRPLPTGDTGSALMTALLSTLVMLALGLALLAIVDTQASQSATERTRDRGFNFSESVLTSEAFVLGRNWPAAKATSGSGTMTAPVEMACSNPVSAIAATLGTAPPTGSAAARLQPNLEATYSGTAYAGATWQVNLCDDTGGSPVWNNATLTNGTVNWDKNDNQLMWVRAQSKVNGRTRAVAGLVKVRTESVFNSKYGLVTGGMTDDLGSSINSLSANALGGVLGPLLGTTPTVAPDPSATTTPPSSGVTGLRCGAADISLIPASTCLAGTIGAAGALPVINSLLTNGTVEQFPTTSTTSQANIDQLRSQAVNTSTYYTSSSGGSTPASAPACTFTTNSGTRGPDTVVFIEKVGTGDQYCVVDVSSGVKWKALVIGSGRVILRGNNTKTGTPGFTTLDAPQVNTFTGVVYALNRQRLPTGEGGLGLGDAAAPGREVVRIENGAHVKGGVNADGRSAKVGVYPPPITINTNALVDTLIPCRGPLDLVNCTLNATVKLLGGVLAIVDRLVQVVGLGAVTGAILDQAQPQRTPYGSAIVADVAAIKRLKVYGASAVNPGTFRDLNPTG